PELERQRSRRPRGMRGLDIGAPNIERQPGFVPVLHERDSSSGTIMPPSAANVTVLLKSASGNSESFPARGAFSETTSSHACARVPGGSQRARPTYEVVGRGLISSTVACPVRPSQM